jgi:hypothetical protein
MQFGQPINRQTSKRVIERAIICSLILLTAFGAIIADTLTKQREANGEVVLELCKKGANGQWTVIDRAKGTITASASVLDVARGKEFKSNLKWDTSSEQGRQISVKQAGLGKATVDIDRGEVTTEIPFNVSVGGQRLSITAKLTNQSTSSPIGTLTGKKLEIIGTKLIAGVAGFVEIKEASVVAQLIKEKNESVTLSTGVKEPTSGAKEPAPPLKGSTRPLTGSNDKQLKNNPATLSTAESVIVVIKAQGNATGQ